MAKVSVIIPTHSRPHLLRRAVESAQAAGSDVEIVVVDDASTDATAEVCKSLEGIRYIRLENNLGVAGARNLGIFASRGDYISFLDDDDVRLPGSLDLQIDTLSVFPRAGLIYGQAIFGNQDGTPTDDFYPVSCPEGDVFWPLLEKNFVPCGSVVFRRSCLYSVGLLDGSLAGIDDWDLWVRISEIFSVVCLKQPVIIWRRSTPTSGQGTSRSVEIVNLSTRQLRDNWLNLPRASRSSPKKRRAAGRGFSTNMASHLVWQASRALFGGQLRLAGNNLRAAFTLHPAGVARLVFRPQSWHYLFTHGPGEWQAIRSYMHPFSRPGRMDR
jgi:glycosyltransferase involved in cell wall biosynthesis